MMFLFYALFIFIVSYFTSYYLSETFSTVYIAERGHWIILFSIISASFLGYFLYILDLVIIKKSGCGIKLYLISINWSTYRLFYDIKLWYPRCSNCSNFGQYYWVNTFVDADQEICIINNC